LDLQRGRRLSIEVTFDSAAAPARLFVDLFWLQPDGRARRVASLEADQRALVHDASSMSMDIESARLRMVFEPDVPANGRSNGKGEPQINGQEEQQPSDAPNGRRRHGQGDRSPETRFSLSDRTPDEHNGDARHLPHVSRISPRPRTKQSVREMCSLSWAATNG
jgi:hypothetical protein